MRVMANVAMVMNLDKCIGCHTCSVTCKQVWTNRPGTEYVYFNNVETKPGIGYPKRYEDQQQWHGGWTLDAKGRLQLKAGGRLRKLLSIFYNPDLPSIDDYGDPPIFRRRTGCSASSRSWPGSTCSGPGSLRRVIRWSRRSWPAWPPPCGSC